MPVKQSEGAERIRYYIYGIIREHHEESVRIPSSYDLAERFGTTRRVAQYELERLIDEPEDVPLNLLPEFEDNYIDGLLLP